MAPVAAARLVWTAGVWLVWTAGLGAQALPDSPDVLIVTAHPDDDAAFAGTVYQITHQLGGDVDLALITDGSGGFRYATLAEPIYGVALTDEAVARTHLPAIRKRELMAGGAIVGLRNYFFFDQLDDAFTTDPEPALTTIWDAAHVRRRLTTLMADGGYDVVLGLLPFAEMHGHHKAATILALQAVEALPAMDRPVVLGGFPCAIGDRPIQFDGLEGYPITRVSSGEPLVRFDRTSTFGYENRLDFRIVSNWVIAEHKSQGVMQLRMNQGDAECYWFFDANDPGRRETVRDLFDRLPPAP